MHAIKHPRETPRNSWMSEGLSLYYAGSIEITLGMSLGLGSIV